MRPVTYGIGVSLAGGAGRADSRAARSAGPRQPEPGKLEPARGRRRGSQVQYRRPRPPPRGADDGASADRLRTVVLPPARSPHGIRLALSEPGHQSQRRDAPRYSSTGIRQAGVATPAHDPALASTPTLHRRGSPPCVAWRDTRGCLVALDRFRSCADRRGRIADDCVGSPSGGGTFPVPHVTQTPGGVP